MAQRPGFPWVPLPGPREQQEDRSEPPQLQKLRTVFSAFQNSSGDLTLAVDLLLHEIAEEARSIPGVCSCAIALWDPEKDFVCRASAGESAPCLGMRIQTQGGLTVECLRTGRQQICQDTETDIRVDAEVCRVLGVRSLVIVPLFLQQRLMGILEVFASVAHAFDKAAIERFNLLGRRVVETVAFAEGQLHPQGQSTGAIPMAQLVQDAVAPVISTAMDEPPQELSSAVRSVVETKPEPGFQSKIQPEIDEVERSATGPTVFFSDVHSPAVLSPSGPAPSLTRIPHPSRKNLGLALVVLSTGIVAVTGLLWWVPRESTQSGVTQADASPEKEALPADTQPTKTVATPDASTTRSTTVVSTRRSSHSAERTALREDSGISSGDLVVYEKGKIVFRGGLLNGGGNRPVTSAAETEKLRDNANPSSTPDDTTPVGVVDFTGGKLIHRVAPMYPAGLSEVVSPGVVVLEGVIGKDGAVHDIRVVRGDPRLTDAATEAVRQWRYEPFRSDGEPVDMLSTMTVHFR